MYRTTLKKSKYCARHSTHTWEPWKSSKIHVTQYRARHRGGVNIKAPKTVKLPHKRNESLRYSTTLKNSKNQTFSKVSYTEGGIPQLCHTRDMCKKSTSWGRCISIPKGIFLKSTLSSTDVACRAFKKRSLYHFSQPIYRMWKFLSEKTSYQCSKKLYSKLMSDLIFRYSKLSLLSTLFNWITNEVNNWKIMFRESQSLASSKLYFSLLYNMDKNYRFRLQ